MFQVRWERRALDELSALWFDADSDLKSLISKATQEIDQILQTNPLGQGESRPGGRRIFLLHH